VIVSAAPLAVIGPLIAAAVTGEWTYLPAGVAVGVGGLLAGAGAAVTQASLVPIAVPESDNPLAGGDSGNGWFAGLVLALVVLSLAVLTLPLALALLWATDRDRPELVSLFALVAVGVGALVLRGGTALAAGRWSARGPELFAAVTPASSR
jgi:hypothetical protein